MIDLHSHTDQSDGTCSPAELIEEAVRAGIHLLGITDHDTFDGYDKAVPAARGTGVELVCGIELSTKLHGRSVHLLGYFLGENGPARDFRDWILEEVGRTASCSRTSWQASSRASRRAIRAARPR